MDVDDLMGEARYVFVKCFRKYWDDEKPISPEHFAGLFRTSFTNAVHKIALKRSVKHIARNATDVRRRENWMERRQGRFYGFGEVNLDMSSAPPHLQNIVYFLTKSSRPPKRKPRETVNDFMRRVGRVQADRDVVSEMLSFLKIAPEAVLA